MQVDLIDLTKRYGSDAPAVADLSLSIPAGRLTALLGPSGCGKTTTLKMIAGLLDPTSGDIHFNGRSILDTPAERRSAVLTFQNHLLFPHMSVADNVAFGLKMRGRPAAEIERRVAEMLDRVQLPTLGKRSPKALSGGQQQRVALARSLVVQPNVLLLDEPLSNLDAHLRDEMRELILSIQQELGITTIVVTHDQEEAVVLADQIALMFRGRLQQFAPPQAFYQRPLTPEIARFFGGTNFLEATPADGQLHLPELPPLSTAVSPPEGRSCTLTIRPEHLALATSDSPNQLLATVCEVIFRGTHTRIKLQAGSFPLEMTTQEPFPHTRGETVWVSLPPDKIHIFNN